MTLTVIDAGDLIIMTRSTFDSVVRTLEGAAVQVSIEHADKASNESFLRAISIAAAADPNAVVHDLLKLALTDIEEKTRKEPTSECSALYVDNRSAE